MVLLNNGALAEEVSGYERASPWQLPTSALHDYHGGVPTGSSLKSPYMMTEAQSVQQWVFKKSTASPNRCVNRSTDSRVPKGQL